MSESSSWGQCKSCKMWQLEPGDEPSNNAVGVCIAEKLVEYQIRVSGNSGCNVYKSGKVKHKEGSSEMPPDPAILVPPSD